MRKRRATKRDVLADPIYNSKVVTKLVNHIMKDGKKGTAQNIIYDVNVTSYATRVINSIKNIDFNDIFSQMLDNSHKEVTRCFTPKFIGSH